MPDYLFYQTREIMRQQDEAFANSLRADQEKVCFTVAGLHRYG